MMWHGHLARDYSRHFTENRGPFTGKMPVATSEGLYFATPFVPIGCCVECSVNTALPMENADDCALNAG